MIGDHYPELSFFNQPSNFAFFAMLDATLPGSDVPPWCAWPWAPAVHLAIMVHRVDTLEPGLYLLVRDPEALAPLRASLRPEWLWRKAGPPELPLYLLMPYDLRDAARQICCHQDIAADSCYALGMLARYEVATSEPWRCRRNRSESHAFGRRGANCSSWPVSRNPANPLTRAAHTPPQRARARRPGRAR